MLDYRDRRMGLVWRWITALFVVVPVLERLWEGEPLLLALRAPIDCLVDVISSPLFLLFAIPLVTIRLFRLAGAVLDGTEAGLRALAAGEGKREVHGTDVVPAVAPRGRGDEASVDPR